MINQWYFQEKPDHPISFPTVKMAYNEMSQPFKENLLHMFYVADIVLGEGHKNHFFFIGLIYILFWGK